MPVILVPHGKIWKDLQITTKVMKLMGTSATLSCDTFEWVEKQDLLR